MIVLQCSRCGHQIEVSDSLRRREIRCARCGNLLAMKAADGSDTEIGMLAPHESADAPSQGEMATNHARDQETFIPKPVVGLPSFSMLSPAKGPEELGRLAHYRILRLLGQGGMGMVFEAVDTHLQRSVALKVMKPEFALDPVAQERFLREARAMAAVKSDYIVTVHQVGQENGLPFLAMEFLQGVPLDEWMKRRGRLDALEIVRLGVQIARGLAAAHQRGLIHRDIKPGNIFLEAGDAGSAAESARPALADHRTMTSTRDLFAGLPADFRVKILDFGLARIAHDSAHLTDPGLLMGTPGYIAPEQVEGKTVDARSDLFSLGCLLYELSTGESPYSNASPLATLMAVLTKTPKPVRELNPGLPPALITLIERLLAKDPKDRPATALEVAAALDAIASAPSSARMEARTPAAVARTARGLRRAIGMIALGVLLGAAAIAWWFLHH